MKSIFHSFLIVPFALVVSCGDPASDPQSPSAAAGTTAVATDYPLETCLVSGEKLGSMGEPVSITHDGREIRFCCDHCIPKFKEDPEKYLAKLPPASE